MLFHDSSDYGSMSVLVFKKPLFLDQLVKIVLLNRSPNSPPSLLLENLIGWVDEKKPDTLLGNFNINAFCTDSNPASNQWSNPPLKHILLDYKLLISESTNFDGGLLEYAYDVSNSFYAYKATFIVMKKHIFQTMML